MHGQLHFRAANSDLRGCAGVLRLLLFNSGEGSPVNFQRIYRRRFEKKEKRQWAINIVRIIVHTLLIESLNLERLRYVWSIESDENRRAFEEIEISTWHPLEGSHGEGEEGSGRIQGFK